MHGYGALRALVARRWELAGLFGGILVPLLAFGALGEDVWERQGFVWDAPLLWAMHRGATPARDAAMILVTDAGGPLPMAVLAALVLALLRPGGGSAMPCSSASR